MEDLYYIYVGYKPTSNGGNIFLVNGLIYSKKRAPSKNALGHSRHRSICSPY